jgi:transcriptional regulator with XRE-family HTH domain
MILKQLRLSRLLSQEQLAQMSGLNVRTIQRIESGHKPSTETLKCLAACRVEIISHGFGFVFCLLGIWSEPALAGGLLLLANAYLFRLHLWLGDKYGVWYDADGLG